MVVVAGRLQHAVPTTVHAPSLSRPDGIGTTTTCKNDLVPERHFFDSSQPQTLQGAVMLSYLNVAIGLLFMLLGGIFGLLLLATVAEGVGAYGIANERRWGYRLCVAASVVILVLAGWVFILGHGVGIINLLFAVLLVALLLHRQSREYQKIWFH